MTLNVIIFLTQIWETVKLIWKEVRRYVTCQWKVLFLKLLRHCSSTAVGHLERFLPIQTKMAKFIAAERALIEFHKDSPSRLSAYLWQDVL